jgi:N-acetylglucosamine repressor
VPLVKKSNQEESRLHNRRLVLTTLYDHDEISRVDIARQTGLTRTTVSQIVADFIATGLCFELGRAPSTGGKPATLLSLAENSRHIIGIDLADSELRGALVNLRGQIIQRIHLPIENRDGDNALALVYDLIAALLAQTDTIVSGIGVGAPGLLDPIQGIVQQAINLNWKNLPLKALLQEKFQLPVCIANDCQVAALGEYIFGSRPASENLILIKAGVGIGAGIVIGGQLFHGDNAGAGEIGHIQVVENGEQCRCGNYGCLETILSNRAIIRQAQKMWVDGGSVPLPNNLSDLTIETLLQGYLDGNFSGKALIGAGAHSLGFVVAHLVSALNINHIRLAGTLSRFGAVLVDPIQERVQQSALSRLASSTQVGISSLGADIVILGAASLILKNEFGLF